MSSLSLEYLYARLPAFMQRDDAALFLKRFLSPLCAEVDAVDALFDAFHRQIAPETASEEFINWFLWSLFGWAYFPGWFTLEQKRAFYRDVALHYARRGTREGIETFLRAFGITARVFNEPEYFEEAYFDEDGWTMTGPLGLVVQIFPSAAALPSDLDYFEEAFLEESYAFLPSGSLARADVDALLDFQQPAGHIIFIEDKSVEG